MPRGCAVVCRALLCSGMACGCAVVCRVAVLLQGVRLYRGMACGCAVICRADVQWYVVRICCGMKHLSRRLYVYIHNIVVCGLRPSELCLPSIYVGMITNVIRTRDVGCRLLHVTVMCIEF